MRGLHSRCRAGRRNGARPQSADQRFLNCVCFTRIFAVSDAASLICSAIAGQISSLQPVCCLCSGFDVNCVLQLCTLALDLFVPAIQKDFDQKIAPDQTCKSAFCRFRVFLMCFVQRASTRAAPTGPSARFSTFGRRRSTPSCSSRLFSTPRRLPRPLLRPLPLLHLHR